MFVIVMIIIIVVKGVCVFVDWGGDPVHNEFAGNSCCGLNPKFAGLGFFLREMVVIMIW